MLLSRKLSLLTAGFIGLCGTLSAQVLDKDLLKGTAEYFEIRQSTNTIKFIQFKEGNGLNGRDFLVIF